MPVDDEACVRLRGKITFDQWGTIVPIVAPKGAIDISKLTG